MGCARFLFHLTADIFAITMPLAPPVSRARPRALSRAVVLRVGRGAGRSLLGRPGRRGLAWARTHCRGSAESEAEGHLPQLAQFLRVINGRTILFNFPHKNAMVDLNMLLPSFDL